MSFFKHIGTNASKFQFDICVNNIIGVYPSSYSTLEHSTDGIYLILKRKNKSYRTKIALPENGGHVHMNDCIQFTSTLYQKKKRNEDGHLLLPKPFILRVCNASHHKIRWETAIDLSDYASVFPVDSNESFKLHFSYKPHKSKPQPLADGMKNIPFEITVRVRIKSTWLKNVDNMSQASTGSVSRISSSVMSDMSDFDNFKMYETLNKTQHSVLFTSLPEEHSIHNSPIKQLSLSSETFIQNQDENDQEMIDKKRDSALQSFDECATMTKPVHLRNLSDDVHISSNSSFRFGQNNFENSSFMFSNSSTRIPNLSLLLSPNKTQKNVEKRKENVPVSVTKNVANDSRMLFEDDFIQRIDEKMNETMTLHTNSKLMDDASESMDIHTLIDLMLCFCINDMSKLKIEDRIWHNLVPIHCAILFRSFLRWNVFNENEDNTQLMLQRYLNCVSVQIQNEIKNNLEQSYWLIRLSTMLYWLHIYFPNELAVSLAEMNKASKSKKPRFQRHDTFENIVDDEEDEEQQGNVDKFSDDHCVETKVSSNSQTQSNSVPIERVNEECINLHLWFVTKLINLSHVCFDNIISNILSKLMRIPYEQVFDENEFGEQGSNTMDMIFAVMNSLFFLFSDICLFDLYRIQICRQILQFTMVKLINHLLSNAAYCTIAGGFRLKVIKSMITAWCQSNGINERIFENVMALSDEISTLLLTCAVAKNGNDLLAMCPSLSAAQINQILNNYNSEATNEPLSAEILTPILEIAASELPSDSTRVSVQNVCFCKEPMKAFNINDCNLPKICLNEIGPIPKEIAQNPSFKFLLTSKKKNKIIL